MRDGAILKKRMLSVVGLLFSGEMFLCLFLYAGYFKAYFTFPVDLTLLFMILSFVVVVKRNIKNKEITKAVFLAIALYTSIFMLILISLFYTESVIYAYDKAIRFSIITGWAFVGALLLIKDMKSLKIFLFNILIISVAMSISSFNLINSNGSLASGYLMNYASVGRASGVGLLILCCLVFFRNTSFKMKLFATTVFALILFSVLISGARMPLIATLTLLVYLYFKSVRIENRILYVNKGFKWLTSLFLLSILSFFTIADSALFSRVMYRLGLLKNIEVGSDPTGRLDRYERAMSMWRDSPLFGEGIGSFGLSFTGVDSTNYPHNIFLEILAELGLFGLLLFLTTLILSFFFMIRAYKNDYTDKAVILAVILGFLYFLFSASVAGDINDNKILITFIALGFSLSRFTHRKSSCSKVDSNCVTVNQ